MNTKELLKKAKDLVEEEKFEEAEKCYEELLKNVDDNSEDAIDVYINYANYFDLAGVADLKKAISYATKAYKLNKKLYKENNKLETLIKQAEIADIFGDLYFDTDGNKMVKYYAEAIKIWKKNLDYNKDFKLFITTNALDIADYAKKTEDFDMASKYVTLAYKTWNKYLKEEPNEEYDIDRITSAVYISMADLILDDDDEKAIKLYKKVIKISKKYKGTEEFAFYGYDYVNALYKLATTYYHKNLDMLDPKTVSLLKEIDNYLKDTEDEEYLEILIDSVKKIESYYDGISDYKNGKKYAVKFFKYAQRQYELDEEKILDYADASFNMIYYSDAIKYKALAIGLAYDMDPEGDTEYYHDRFMEMAHIADNIEEDYDIWMDLYEKKYNKKH